MAEQLTKSDIVKIQEEIDNRKLVIRPQLIEAVKEARAHGDLSENFEYHAAKREKNQNESRIRYLEGLIRRAVIISDESKDDEVGLNKYVTVYMEDDDEEETYKLVTSIRASSIHNMISTESPMGRAIMHRRIGERVYVKIDEQNGYYVVIRKIEKTGDEDDKIRSY